jgi:aryl-alcohol dehydrogenase-like predicted oxidoreductase
VAILDVAAVALAWLLAQPRVVAPIASAWTTEQLEQILPAARLELTTAEVDRLSATTQAALGACPANRAYSAESVAPMR